MDIMGFFGNNDRDSKSLENALESIKADYDALQAQLTARDEEIASLRSRIAELEAQQPTPVPNDTPEAIANTPTAEPTPAPEVAPSSEVLNALATAIAELKAQTSEIKEVVSNSSVTTNRNVGELSNNINCFKPEFYDKVTKPYMMALIDLHRRFYENYKIFANVEVSEVDLTEAYKDLLEQFNNAVNAISDRVYNDFSIEYFEPSIGEAFDPKRHQVMEIVETAEEEKHLTIAKVLYGCFQNIDTQKVIRPARIACYKFVAPAAEEQNTAANETPQEA